MYAIADLQLFLHTADSGSLSKAARLLDMLPATASAGLKRLERQLQAPLFVRSTRSMRLTPEGEIFLDYCRDALALLREGETLIHRAQDKIDGHLRLSMPSDIGRNVVLPWLNEFQQQYPGVTLSLQFSDRFTDLFRDPIDIALRSGRLTDSSLVSQQLAPSRRVAVASPAYLQARGVPQRLQDLTDHNCLLYYLRHGLFNQWRFYAGAETFDIKVKGDRMCDDAAVAREWAVAGYGIAYKSALDVRQDLRSGRLVKLLPAWQGEDVPLNAVYPHRHTTAAPVRALVSFLRQRFEAEAASDAIADAAANAVAPESLPAPAGTLSMA